MVWNVLTNYKKKEKVYAKPTRRTKKKITYRFTIYIKCYDRRKGKEKDYVQSMRKAIIAREIHFFLFKRILHTENESWHGRVNDRSAGYHFVVSYSSNPIDNLENDKVHVIRLQSQRRSIIFRRFQIITIAHRFDKTFVNLTKKRKKWKCYLTVVKIKKQTYLEKVES